MKLRAFLVLLGLFSLTYLINKYGFYELKNDLSQVGLWIIPLFLAYIPAVALYSLAWIFVTPKAPLSQWFNYAKYTVIGVAWNNLSPFIKILGEPLKVDLLMQTLSKKDALKSVILYNMIHIVGTILAILFVLLDFVYFRNIPSDLKATIWFSLLFVFLLFLGLLYFPKIKWGSTKKRNTSRLARKIRRASISLRWSLMIMRIFSLHHRWRFYGSVACEVAARFIEGLIFYIAYISLNSAIDIHSAFRVDVGRTFIDNLTFFIPYQVGSREAGLTLLTEKILQTGEEKILAATMLYRIVELLWVVAGYLLWIIPKSSRKSLI